MAIAGIEGLAQGFMQGMALKRQNDRQDVLDAQNLERFSMDKERFATQQAASAFDLQNAQTNAANAAIDRTRTLGIQKKGDEFEANLGRIMGAGAPENQLMELEKVHQANGVKGAFARDPKTGGLAKSADGKFQWVNEGGSTENVTLEDSIGRYIAKAKPLQKAESDMKTASEIASENRKEKTTIAAEVRAAKTAKEKDERDYQQALALENVKTANIIKAAKSKGTLKDPKDYMSKLSQQAFYDVQETIDPYTKAKTYSKPIFNQAKYNDFVLFTHKNDINPDDAAYRLWVSIGNQGQPQGQNTNETYKSNSLGYLTVTGGLDKQSAEVPMDGVAKLNLGNQGAAQPVQPASPVSGLTTRPPAQAQTNKEVAIPAKPVKKVQVLTKISGMRGSEKQTKINNPYQEIQGKFGDPIPDGFKRKKSPFGTDIRTPEYNTFVSNNYQD